MSITVSRLNDILADERACMRTLCRADVQGADPSHRELVKRVLAASGEVCTELEKTIRALGGKPVSHGESLADNLRMAEYAQQYIIAKIDAVMNEPELKRYGEPLLAIRQFHADNIRWLAKALGAK